MLRDQAPLREGNAALDGGWTFADLVEDLNGRVFFWPGTERRPIPDGQRHFERYADESIAVLMVDTTALFAANGGATFCRYNSGSPRWSGGRPSPRGPGTFVAAADAPFTAGQVVEVTFRNTVVLPNGAVRVKRRRMD